MSEINPVLASIIVVMVTMIAVPILVAILNFAMPLRALVAFLRAPISKRHLKAFWCNQTSTVSRKIRLWSVVSLYTSTIILIVDAIFRYTNEIAYNKFISSGNIIALFVLIIGIVILLLGPIGFLFYIFSYIYEFYAKKDVKIFSFSFFMLISHAVCIPFLCAYLSNNIYGFNAARSSGYIVTEYAISDDGLISNPKVKPDERRKHVVPRGAELTLVLYELSPVKNEDEQSACNKYLDINHWRLTGAPMQIITEENKRYTIYEATPYVVLAFYFNEFVNDLFFEAPSAFGCSIVSAKLNSDNFSYSFIYFTYKLLFSIFSIAVISAPFSKILSKYNN